MKKPVKTLTALLPLLLAVAFLATVIFPVHVIASAANDVAVRWSDGSVTAEKELALTRDFSCIEGEQIFFERAGKVGCVALSARAKEVVSQLQTAPLSDLLSLTSEGLSRIEKFAVQAEFGNRVYYDGDYFAWEDGFTRVSRRRADTVVLLSGELPYRYLEQSGATELVLHPLAELSAWRLVDSRIGRVTAFAPYSFEGGAIYKDTAGGRRLVALLPTACEAQIECDFIDDYALVAAQSLQSLILPFAGNGREKRASDFYGAIYTLFGDSVPDTLTKLTVTGGSVCATAFYRMTAIEELNLCGAQAESTAFSQLPNLQRLHTAGQVKLSGFSAQTLACGCTLYGKL